jgi:arylsulfatase A-like enzyme
MIDLGTPAADAHLRAGWSRPERLPSGETGAWAVARRATVQLAIGDPRDGRLVVRAGLFAPGELGAVVLTVSLNGRRAGLLRLRSGLAEHTLRAPSRLLRSGLNVIEFMNPLLLELPRSRRRQRARAAAFDWIRLEDVQDTRRRPFVVGDASAPRALVLPGGTRVDFFVRLPSHGELALGVEPDGGAGSALLHVELEREAEQSGVLLDRPAPASIRLPLPGPAGAVARLSLAAAGDGALRVLGPRVLGTTPAPEGRRPTPRAPATRPSILLYVVDTLRADALGCYGHAGSTSPSIDALAADGVLFTRVVAQSSWTKPATASILTGLDPGAHGAVTVASAIRPEAPMLAESLRASGYGTAAFVTNVNVEGQFGFQRGFEEYRYFHEDRGRPTIYLPGAALNERIFPWLERRGEEPFLLYVHASDPHAPYRPPDEIAARYRPPGPTPPVADASDPLEELERNPASRTPESLAWVRSLYDGDVAVLDEAFGALLAKLRALGLYDRMMIVLTADHGEEFGEHGGLEHGRTLYREMLAVPLVVRLPGGASRGTRLDAPARQIDIAPTILAAAGVPVPPGMRGVPLLPPLGQGPREAVSQTILGHVDVIALTTAEWKIVHNVRREGDCFELYALADDPDERRDLAAERPVLVGYGRQILARTAVDVPRASCSTGETGIVLDDETAMRLRALGYVDR